MPTKDNQPQFFHNKLRKPVPEENKRVWISREEYCYILLLAKIKKNINDNDGEIDPRSNKTRTTNRHKHERKAHEN